MAERRRKASTSSSVQPSLLFQCYSSFLPLGFLAFSRAERMNAYQVSIPQTIGAALHSIVILAALLWYLLTGGRQCREAEAEGYGRKSNEETKGITSFRLIGKRFQYSRGKVLFLFIPFSPTDSSATNDRLRQEANCCLDGGRVV